MSMTHRFSNEGIFELSSFTNMNLGGHFLFFIRSCYITIRDSEYYASWR